MKRLILPSLLVCALLISLLAVGCASRRQSYIESHPKLDQATKSAITEGRIIVGMTKEQVTASWGTPTLIDEVKENDVVWERWYYGGGGTSPVPRGQGLIPVRGTTSYTKARAVFFRGDRAVKWRDL